MFDIEILYWWCRVELQFRSGFERSDHQMIDDGDQNVDDVSPIKLDTIIPNNITTRLLEQLCDS